MRFNLIVVFLFIIQSISSQEKKTEFKVQLNNKEKVEFKSDFNSFEHKFDFFYEDENYIVKDSCRGEFGGTVEFRNKKTEKVYVAKATCPSSLIKIDGKYYLTTSLAHLSGFSGIYEIADPTKLTELKEDDSEKDKFFKKKSDSGLKELYRNIGGTILVSFPYNDKLYFITSDRDGTYLTERKESKLVKIKKLLDFKVYTYETGIKITDDNHYVNNFQIGYGKEIGFFDIKDNVIKINLYK
jgi:hypothetical protein